MSKDLNISILMDFYGQLLTDKQLSTLDLYYNQDFSLAEIAQNMNITRQGVRDAIKRGEKQLREFEDSLGLAKKFIDITNDFEKMEKSIYNIQINNTSPEIVGDLTTLQEILDNIKSKL